MQTLIRQPIPHYRQPTHYRLIISRAKTITLVVGCYLSYPAVRINQVNNPDLIIAMQLCEVQISYKGFHKDKSQEKKPESEDTLPLQQRTDFTDAFDTLYLGCKFFRGGGGWFVLPSGR